MAKVDFNGPSKLIIVDPGETELSVKVDLYSAWKDWVVIGDNSKYQVAMSAIGGDPIGGGRFLGTTFFMENGWKIRPYEGDHTLLVDGNLYSRDGSSPFVRTIGDYNVVINTATSNIVDSIAVEGGAAGPTASEIASAIWDKTAIAHVNSGSFGEFVNMIKAMSEATSTDVSLMKTKLDTASLLVESLVKYQGNRTKIDQTAKTMTIYEDDGTTVYKVFDLKDFLGNPSITQVAERVPR